MPSGSRKYVQTVLEGRKKFLKLSLDQRQEILNIYDEASKDVIERLKKVKHNSMTERYLKELQKAIDEYRRNLAIELDKAIRKAMNEAAELGVEPSKAYFENMDIPFTLRQTFKSMFTNVSEEVVSVLVTGEYYKDGKTLSQRIWNITGKNGSDIDKLIKRAIIEQKNTSDLARELEMYMNSGIARPQKTFIPGISRDISYQAVRLARTSISHSMLESCVQASMDNPYSLGLKWNLSSEHTSRLAKFGRMSDVCDTYAKQDLYDLGSGVYPAEKYPLGHPNCLCYSTDVLVPLEEASAEIIAWINGEENPKLDEWAKRHGFNI